LLLRCCSAALRLGFGPLLFGQLPLLHSLCSLLLSKPGLLFRQLALLDGYLFLPFRFGQRSLQPGQR
jgi:hypothetical protein